MEEVVRTEREFDYANGLVVNLETSDSQTVLNAPHTLFPTRFPRSAFLAAVDLAVPFGELYYAVANDADFLASSLAETCETDVFTRRLLEIMKATQAVPDKHRQAVQCAILRSDYMLQSDAIKQVEINTISASFASLSSRVSRLHRHMATLAALGNAPALGREFHFGEIGQLPANEAELGLVQGLAAAFGAYSAAGEGAVIVFVVQERERNKYDQLHVQQLLCDTFGIAVFRQTLAEMGLNARRDPQTNRLMLNIGERVREVAVVYYRAGYGPTDYPGEKEWETRTLIELSLAIKVPTVAWQLAGTKKVQQVLAKPQVLAKYARREDTDKIAASFAGLFELTEASIAAAISRPDHYVLKPQREGGGNNFYGAEMTHHLQTMKREEWGAFILMELLVSTPIANAVLRDNAVTSGLVVSELGIYSALIRNSISGETVFNRSLGHLLRTKFSHTNESGVSAGFGALDSPLLV